GHPYGRPGTAAPARVHPFQLHVQAPVSHYVLPVEPALHRPAPAAPHHVRGHKPLVEGGRLPPLAASLLAAAANGPAAQPDPPLTATVPPHHSVPSETSPSPLGNHKSRNMGPRKRIIFATRVRTLH